MGAAAFLLLPAHPLLLAFAAAEISLAAAVRTLLPATHSLATGLGWAALLLTMIFLAPSFGFFGGMDYQRWIWLHRLSGPAVVLALVHTFMLSRSLPPFWNGLLWGGLALLAVAAVVDRWGLSRHVGCLRYRVREIARRANNVVELTLEPQGRRLDYAAGQFIYLTPYDRQLAAGFREEHPYTLSSAPGEPDLRVAIKALGEASLALQQVTLGSDLLVKGPYGDFFPPQAGREVWIAGGIGITPFLGRARHLAALGKAVDIHLLCCVQDPPRALFSDELRALTDRIDGFRLTLHYFYREGPLNAVFLRACCPDYAQRTAYICGPTPLIDLGRHLLLAGGSPRNAIHTEEFTLLLKN